MNCTLDLAPNVDVNDSVSSVSMKQQFSFYLPSEQLSSPRQADFSHSPSNLKTQSQLYMKIV